MTTRRDFMATAALGTAALALAPRTTWAKPESAKPPMRFVFLHKGNGQIPSHLALPSFSKEDAAAEGKKTALNRLLG